MLGGNDEFMSELGMAAGALHEAFQEFVKAGFTEDQALKLVLGIVGHTMRQGGE